jgi:mitochondrial fusion and transport protein UGO1
MASQREGVNPLRPYYIGERADPLSGAAGAATSSSGRYATRARDVFNDLDYGYLGDEAPSVVQNVKDLLDELLWKYCSVLMAQPFEVAKTILQVRDQDENAAASANSGEPGAIKRTSSYGGSIYDVCDHGYWLFAVYTVTDQL